jgi:hypothetical protein
MSARMNAAWRAFADELARWRDAGRAVEFWWRDDDAARPSPALARLLALAQASGTPLALAVIPLQAEPEMLAGIGPGVTVLQHGSDHRNRAAAGAKKTEYPAAEAATAAVARLVAARGRLSALAGSRLLPVLAPPWNRLPETHAPLLAAAGFRGLSRYGARVAAQAAPGLTQVNTHVDLIDWQGGRGFAGEEAVLAAAVKHLAAKRAGQADAKEATGWLSHHAVHDDAAWNFLEQLFQTARAVAGVRWLGARELFHIS